MLEHALHVAPGSTQIPWPLSARTVQLDQLMTTRSQPLRAPAALLALQLLRATMDLVTHVWLASTPMQVQLNAPTVQRARAITTNSLLPLVRDVSRASTQRADLLDHATVAPLVASIQWLVAKAWRRVTHACLGRTRARDHRLALSALEAPLTKTVIQQRSVNHVQPGRTLAAVRLSAMHALQVRSTATSVRPRHVQPASRANTGKLAP